MSSAIATTPTRTCSRCESVKPTDEFHRNPKSGHGYWCKECERERHRERMERGRREHASAEPPSEKRCSACGGTFGPEAFYASTRDQLGGWCKQCSLARGRETRAQRKREFKSGERQPAPEKRCSRCLEIKPADAFNFRPETRSGLASRCRECMAAVHEANRETCNARTRAYARKHRDRLKAIARLRCYGITSDEFAQVLAEQDGRCAVCGDDERPLVIDHDHQTLRFRGLLCDLCNRGLGLFRDDSERLHAAVEYLARPQGKLLSGTKIERTV